MRAEVSFAEHEFDGEVLEQVSGFRPRDLIAEALPLAAKADLIAKGGEECEHLRCNRLIYPAHARVDRDGRVEASVTHGDAVYVNSGGNVVTFLKTRKSVWEHIRISV